MFYFVYFFTQEKFVTLYPKHPVCISFIVEDIFLFAQLRPRLRLGFQSLRLAQKDSLLHFHTGGHYFAHLH
jgi:hypothetical protein